MHEVQRVAVWPATVRDVVDRKETAYRLLDNKAGRVARAAWWLLNWLGALRPYVETIHRWDYVPSQQGPLCEAMLAALDQDLRYIRDGQAVFIMGGATFSELTGAPAFRDQMKFTAGPFYTEHPYHGREVFGVPIHVVPHMTGMAVVPKILVEKRA